MGACDPGGACESTCSPLRPLSSLVQELNVFSLPSSFLPSFLPSFLLPQPCATHGTCTAPDTCTCSSPGWAGDPTCSTCAKGYAGPTCKECPGGHGDVCSEHGVCFGNGKTTGNATCGCDSGWRLDDCRQFYCEFGCVHGTCVGADNCKCDAGFSGEACDQPVCPDGCINGRCAVGVPAGSPNVCNCKEGWTHVDCSVPICNQNCLHGTCTLPNHCECLTGWKGDSCDKPNCFDDTVDCSGHGKCFAPNECQCETGFSGDKVRRRGGGGEMGGGGDAFVWCYVCCCV